jgi:type I restriction enzyme S subunit
MFPNLPANWSIKKIGELCDVSRGSSPRPIHDQRYFVGGTIPWIKIADATKSGKYLYKTKQYVNEYGASFSKVLPPGTILVAASGTLGYTQILGVEGCAHDGWLILQNLHDVDRDYLYYAIQWMNKHFYNSAYGAAIQNINTMILQDTEIPCPPTYIQNNIGKILSVYDDLIENNSRRIKILEEMAKWIYREWFVHYRFPGYENCKIIDSGTEYGTIPEGWKVKKVGDAFQTVGGSTPSTTKPEYWENGDINWYSPSDLTARKAMFINSSGKKINKLGLQNSSATMFPPYSVMMTSRATIGVVSLNTTTACTNQGFITCIPNNAVSAYQIYFWILENLEKINNIASGATYKEINRTEFRDFDFIVTDGKTKQKFDEYILPIGKQIETLLYKNDILHETLGILLPKLISGEIDVSELDIQIE